MHPPKTRIVPIIATASLATLLFGCSSYRVPGGPAEISLFAEREIKTELQRVPVAKPPIQLAVARVQAPHYRSYSSRGENSGRFSVVTVRSNSENAVLERIKELSEVEQATWLNRLLLESRLQSEKDLRVGAASLHADMLFIYTLDTRFHIGDPLTPLTVVTLGLSPHQTINVDATASGILLDVQTRYVYGSCDASAHKQVVASAWTSADQIDRTRLDTENSARAQMIVEFEKLWPSIIASLSNNASSRQVHYVTSSNGNK